MSEGLAPQYAVGAAPKGSERTARGTPKLMLTLNVDTGGSVHTFYLCDASDNFQDIAKQLHDKINQAGREARRAESGLAVVTGGNSDGLRTEKQGREFRRPRPEGA